MKKDIRDISQEDLEKFFSENNLQKFRLKQFSELDSPTKPRWPLDKDAAFLKGAGVKL